MATQINWLNVTPLWGREIAENPKTSIEALKALAAHSDIEVRTAVAEHWNTPLKTVLKLARDDSSDLRYAIAENHSIHKNVLKVLAEDDNPFVAHRAKKTLERKKHASNVPAVLNPKPLRLAHTDKKTSFAASLR